MDKEYITRLLQRYFSNEATHAEREALFAELEKFRNNEDWVDIHTQLLSQAEEIKDYNPERYQSIIEKILAPKTKIIPIYRRRIFKWVAAAVVLIAIATTYTVISKRSGKSPATEVAKTNDVPAPSNTRAVITLADGRKVYLDSVNNGTIARENNVSVLKNEKGEIIYSHEDTKTQSEIAYNTLSNPRGSKVISLTLSDGTKVWLNSESSLKYPIAFTSNTREVEITGEAYFEVKHNAQQPFKVHLPNGSIVEDIGTSFNINSYSDENDIKTTLIEGSVKVLSPAGGGDLNESSNNKRPGVDNGVILKPGQQSVQIPNIRDIRVQNNVDMDEVLAWKDGYFHFESADLKTILKEFARWYDIEVIYEGSVSNEKYFTIISRTTNLNDVLKSLQANNIQFRIEGKKLFVTSG